MLANIYLFKVKSKTKAKAKNKSKKIKAKNIFNKDTKQRKKEHQSNLIDVV